MKRRSKHLLLLLWLSPIIYSCNKQLSASGKPADDDVIETAAPIQTGVTENVTNNIGGYVQSLPSRYDSSTKTYPLLICLHGVGELGNGSSDLWKVGSIATPGLIKNGKFPPNFTVNNKNYSFIVIAPQFKSWPSPADVNAIIDRAIAKLRIDKSRIYLNGLSMGGGAVWENAAAYNDRLAAIAPICGSSSPTDNKAQKIAQGGIAVWAFHNEDDATVSVFNSKNYVSKINSFFPGVSAQITLWPSGGHDAWTKATDPNYKENGRNMYEWMLQYARPPKQ